MRRLHVPLGRLDHRAGTRRNPARGSLFSQSDAGPFWIDATILPSDSANFQGFRGAR